MFLIASNLTKSWKKAEKFLHLVCGHLEKNCLLFTFTWFKVDDGFNVFNILSLKKLLIHEIHLEGIASQSYASPIMKVHLSLSNFNSRNNYVKQFMKPQRILLKSYR